MRKEERSAQRSHLPAVDHSVQRSFEPGGEAFVRPWSLRRRVVSSFPRSQQSLVVIDHLLELLILDVVARVRRLLGRAGRASVVVFGSLVRRGSHCSRR